MLQYSTCKEQSLTDESLATLMCRVKEILNYRPLTKANDDIHYEEALTPHHFLASRGASSVIPGMFTLADVTCIDNDDKSNISLTVFGIACNKNIYCFYRTATCSNEYVITFGRVIRL